MDGAPNSREGMGVWDKQIGDLVPINNKNGNGFRGMNLQGYVRFPMLKASCTLEMKD